MIRAGVESYVADYRAKRLTYDLPDGDNLTLAVEMPDAEIAPAFDRAAVKAAIRSAQQGVVMYPEFKRLTMQHVSYFGRRGETLIEDSPA